MWSDTGIQRYSLPEGCSRVVAIFVVGTGAATGSQRGQNFPRVKGTLFYGRVNTWVVRGRLARSPHLDGEAVKLLSLSL